MHTFTTTFNKYGEIQDAERDTNSASSSFHGNRGGEIPEAPAYIRQQAALRKTVPGQQRSSHTFTRGAAISLMVGIVVSGIMLSLIFSGNPATIGSDISDSPARNEGQTTAPDPLPIADQRSPDTSASIPTQAPSPEALCNLELNVPIDGRIGLYNNAANAVAGTRNPTESLDAIGRNEWLLHPDYQPVSRSFCIVSQSSDEYAYLLDVEGLGQLWISARYIRRP
jgi:hypothetical protein